MGRLIDETNLMNLLYALDDARHDLCYAIKKIPELPTVEAILKDQYDARLKLDMESLLKYLLIEIEDLDAPTCDYTSSDCISKWQVQEIIQQKIDKLKGNKNGNK